MADLEGPDVAQRIRAIKWAGDNKVTQAVPLLVDRLCEQDESVRFFAIEALRRITGTDRGYDYRADARRRAESVAEWRSWIAQHADSTKAKEQGTDAK